MSTPAPNESELNELLLEGLRQRILFPFSQRHQGKVVLVWKHVEHTTDAELKNALTEEQVRAHWARGGE